MFSAGCELSKSRLRQLKHVRNSFNSAISIIAIHVPRFDYERSPETVKRTLEELRITFPTLHDPDLEMWKRFDARTIPSVSLLKENGELIQGEHGTLTAAQFQDVFQSGPDIEPLPVEADSPNNSKDLVYPTHVAKSNDGFLAVSDPGNGLIMVSQHEPGAGTAQIMGYIDELLRPSAVIFSSSGTLIAADTDRGTVNEYNIESGQSRLLAKDLRSPGGLCFDTDGSLFISDGAANTIFRISAGSDSVDRFQKVAGNGDYGSTDGSSTTVELAQPNGMARTEFGLYFCESASSKIRMLTDAGNIVTKNGRPGFDWGFSDGIGSEALLQRPTDIASLGDGSLLISDTGNSTLRLLTDGHLSTVAIDGLIEPYGLFVDSDQTIFVTDAFNARILTVAADFGSAQELIFK